MPGKGGNRREGLLEGSNHPCRPTASARPGRLGCEFWAFAGGKPVPPFGLARSQATLSMKAGRGRPQDPFPQGLGGARPRGLNLQSAVV